MNIKCSVCRDDRKVTLEDAPLGLYRCASCPHVFKEIPPESRERYREDYFSEAHKNWFNNPDYRLFGMIGRGILKLKGPARLKVLDIGCGRGDLLKYLKGANPALELHGIDFARNRHPGINFIEGDIMEREIPEKFDVICNIAAIEHIGSPHALVGKMKKLLSPDGVLFVITDNDAGMIYSAARLLKRMGIGAPYDRLYSAHHLHCFSPDSLKRLFEMNGFELITRKNHNHPVEAIDYPRAGPVTMALFRIAARMIFFLSTMFGCGILQIAVFRNKGDSNA